MEYSAPLNCARVELADDPACVVLHPQIETVLVEAEVSQRLLPLLGAASDHNPECPFRFARTR